MLKINTQNYQTKVMNFFLSLVFLAITSNALADTDTVTETPASDLAAITIKHPTGSDEFYVKRDKYFLEILELALKKSGNQYLLESVKLPTMTEKRSAVFIEDGYYDIHWMMTNQEHEEKLLPIRIPLYKGLIGWRLLLIRGEEQESFSNIDTVEELKTFVAGQGYSWPDSTILKGNGFNLEVSPDWLSLFKLLEHQRIDYFPRSVIEIRQEIDAFPELNFVVEKYLMLHYPAAYYFFVSKNNIALAKAVEAGLNIAIADGTFNEIFMRHFGDKLRQANLNNRKLLTISNPLLSDETPLERSELWFSIADLEEAPTEKKEEIQEELVVNE